MNKQSLSVIHDKILADKIYFIRGQKVMIDKDLAELYGVYARTLNQAVKRNIERFPEDFMFQLSREESNSSRSQSVTLKRGQNLKYLPYAFTEQGVAMLSSVLNSKQAIAVNIQIIRVFTKMREIISSNKEILLKLEQLEQRVGDNSADIEEIFSVLKNLINPDLIPRKTVGYKWKKGE